MKDKRDDDHVLLAQRSSLLLLYTAERASRPRVSRYSFPSSRARSTDMSSAPRRGRQKPSPAHTVITASSSVADRQQAPTVPASVSLER
jgi:hypothetical protein